MFNFLEKLKKNLTFEKKDKEKNIQKLITSSSIDESIEISKYNLKVKFKKPQQYSGNRNLFDSGSAKRNAKIDLFSNNDIVIDSYTGSKLELSHKAAKAKYGKNWDKHSAETDHKVPLKKIHSTTKENPWVTTEDIKNIANSDENLEVISRTLNNAKRDRTNEELVMDEEYLKRKDLNLSEESKKKAIDSGKQAQKYIKKQMWKTSIKNIVSSGHESGLHAAKNAGTMGLTIASISSITSVIKGQKSATEAIKEISIDTGKVTLTGYISGGGITVLSHSLSSSSSHFLRALSESNVPTKVITGVTLIGNTLKRYTNGEISTQECLLELGEKGINFTTTGYSMIAGQSLIPIPVVGAAIGALVGSAITSKYYNDIVNKLKLKELDHQERLYLIEEAELVAQESKKYREELERYLENYFEEYKNCFDEALSEIKIAFESGDADSIISGANKITRKLGGKVNYDNTEEFKLFLSSKETDIF